MRKLGAGIILSTALVAGCSSTQEELPQPSTATSEAPASAIPTVLSYEEQVASVIEYANAARGYWLGQGVDVSSTKLEIVEAQEAVICGDAVNPKTVTIRSTDPAAGYCHYIDTIFFTEAYLKAINTQPRLSSELPREELDVAHEYGHPAQYAMRITVVSDDYLQNPVKYELQADCFAGQTIRMIDPEASQIVQSPDFKYLHGDENEQTNMHGTTEQRRASFIAGFNGDNCRG